jgi:hypothetical protein
MKRLEAVKNSRNAGDFEELALVIGALLSRETEPAES